MKNKPRALDWAVLFVLFLITVLFIVNDLEYKAFRSELQQWQADHDKVHVNSVTSEATRKKKLEHQQYEIQQAVNQNTANRLDEASAPFNMIADLEGCNECH